MKIEIDLPEERQAQLFFLMVANQIVVAVNGLPELMPAKIMHCLVKQTDGQKEHSPSTAEIRVFMSLNIHFCGSMSVIEKEFSVHVTTNMKEEPLLIPTKFTEGISQFMRTLQNDFNRTAMDISAHYGTWCDDLHEE